MLSGGHHRPDEGTDEQRREHCPTLATVKLRHFLGRSHLHGEITVFSRSQPALLSTQPALLGAGSSRFFFFLPWLLNTAVSCFSIVSLTMPQLHASLGLGHQILLSALFIAQQN
jgi:hypothetical protein